MPNHNDFRMGRKSWTNWHHSVRQPVKDLWSLDNLDAPATPQGLRQTTGLIQAVLADALAERLPVRAFGGGWSFSRVAASDGWMLDTKLLNRVFPVSAASLVPARAGEAAGLFLFQCGNNVSEVHRYLETKKNRSLRTCGASNGQTLAGGVATGTHGSAIDEGAIQDHVVGLHLITGPDRHIWLEPASEPVVSQKFVDSLGAELVRDDALFGAALVGFGSFGIVHALMIRTTERFLLEAHRSRTTFGPKLKQVVTTLDFGAFDMPDPATRPYFFQAVIDPHSTPHPAYVTTIYKRPFAAGHKIDYAIEGGLRPGYDLLGFLGALTDAVPALTPTLVSKVTKERFNPFDAPRIGTLGETFDFTTPRSKAAGMAVGVPLERTVEALGAIGKVHDRVGPAPVVFALRFVRKSKGLLAFTRFDTTCVIDLDGVASTRTTRFFAAVAKGLADAGIPQTQHWGKMNTLDAASVRAMYGDRVDRWRAARRAILPDAAHRRLFANKFLADLALDD